MDKLFDSLKGFIKPFHKRTIIDNNVFQCHYIYTLVILLAFSLIVTAKQYFGDPIECVSRDDFGQHKDSNKILKTYCWVHTTFSVESAWHKNIEHEVPYPGIDKKTKDDKPIYHAYYQWVWIVLLLQGLAFYIPRHIWRAVEGGRMKKLVLGMKLPILNQETRTTNQSHLVDYLHESFNNHNYEFIVFALCEVLNLANVILQMWLMDLFLGGEFSQFGWEVLAFTEWDWTVRYDPMLKVFPRLTKCTFRRYGSSGDVQHHDAMCLLPINIVNEKIYIFLWFWFYFLAIISVGALVYRLATILYTRMRYIITKSRVRMADGGALETLIMKHANVGDWFMLDLVSKNLDPSNFRDVVIDLYKKREGIEADGL